MRWSVSGWQEFIIGDLFEKLQLDVKKEDFNKTFDVSEERTEEFNLPPCERQNMATTASCIMGARPILKPLR